MPRDSDQTTVKAASDSVPVNCGIIMPISATANQTERHWTEVQTLLHRFVSEAGFNPVNVWENSSTDRVSERIIGNIFNSTLVIADISDLNPNVMLELGLRFASKKPTIVIVNTGGRIPFDIGDFHVLDYPADLNMLGMEKFSAKLNRILVDKYESYMSDDYFPFLGRVVVDVVKPQEREVTSEQLIASQLTLLSDRLNRIEVGLTDRSRPLVENNSPGSSGRIFFSVPENNFDVARKGLLALYEVDEVKKRRVVDGFAVAYAEYSEAHDVDILRGTIRRMLADQSGKLGIHRV